jgi:hypothetical protein
MTTLFPSLCSSSSFTNHHTIQYYVILADKEVPLNKQRISQPQDSKETRAFFTSQYVLILFPMDRLLPYLFRHCSYIPEAFAKYNKHFLCSTPQS